MDNHFSDVNKWRLMQLLFFSPFAKTSKLIWVRWGTARTGGWQPANQMAVVTALVSSSTSIHKFKLFPSTFRLSVLSVRLVFLYLRWEHTLVGQNWMVVLVAHWHWIWLKAQALDQVAKAYGGPLRATPDSLKYLLISLKYFLKSLKPSFAPSTKGEWTVIFFKPPSFSLSLMSSQARLEAS